VQKWRLVLNQESTGIAINKWGIPPRLSHDGEPSGGGELLCRDSASAGSAGDVLPNKEVIATVA
jgi:hypothetical protein